MMKMPTILSQKKESGSQEKKSMSSLTDTAIRTTARTLKKIRNNAKNGASLKHVRLQQGSSQSIVPIKTIRDGVIITSDNRYVSIVEILPQNYNKKTVQEQAEILRAFGDFFRNDISRFAFKIVSDTSDTSELIHNVRMNCRNQDNPKVKEIMENYISFIQTLVKNDTVVKRYFYIYEYNGINGEKSSDIQVIMQQMMEARNVFMQYMMDCGNACVYPKEISDINYATTDMLYRFFNKQSSKEISLDERYERMSRDYAEFTKRTGIKKEISTADLVGSKGIKVINRNYICIDGYFYAWLGIRGDSWPIDVYGAWTEVFDYGISVDTDIIFKRLPRESTMLALKQFNRLRKANIIDHEEHGRAEKARRAFEKFANSTEVYQKMQAGDELYDAAIILTIRAATPALLEAEMNRIKNHIKVKIGLDYDECYLCCEEYFLMSMPLLFMPTRLFSRLKHNITSSQIASIYPFVSFQLNDPNGCVLGLNDDNESIVSMDNFNTKMYMNANWNIFGSSGAGKTYTQQFVAYRLYLNGVRCFFVLPKKGYEYYPGCDAIDGKFISLGPGAKHRINIMEIRPEGEIDESLLDDSVSISSMTGSWRSHKIVDLCTWMDLSMRCMGNQSMTLDEYNELNAGLIRIYERHGITDNNASIFKDRANKKLKEMPIIEEWYNEANKSGLKTIAGILDQYVTGPCKNMNGQTNIDLEGSRYVAFDIDEDRISAKLFSPFLYIAFSYVYSEVKSDLLSKDMIFMDEAWKLMATEMAAEQIRTMVKLVRGYGGATVIATQQIGDMLKSAGEAGISVITNSEITLLLAMQKKDLDAARDALGLTPEIYQQAKALKRGTGLLLSRDEVIKVRLKASDMEDNIFSTDINDRQRKKIAQEAM